MGGLLSFCADPSGEDNKPGALADANANDIVVEGGPMLSETRLKEEDRTFSMRRREQDRVEEAARLELLVSTAGRDMVSVRSTRGATYYHDQGFAAALFSHLQQTLPQNKLKPKLPAATDHVVAVLSRPIPAHPEDRRWESLLTQTSGSKEQIFAKCPQIVESLL
jgi:hypothetical protein